MSAYAAGRVGNVVETPAGSALAADVSSGDSSLTVYDPTDFDELDGELTVGSETIPYTDCDEDTGVITLGVTLSSDHSQDDDVLCSPLTVERWAFVYIGDSAADEEGMIVRVPHALYDKLPIGIRDQTSLDGETVELEKVGDDWIITDITGQVPVVDGSFIAPGTLPTESGSGVGGGSDGLPPGASPTPTIIGGIGELFVSWEPIVNHDPVTYKVYADVTSGFTPDDGSNLIGQTPADMFSFRTTADGNALQPLTDYYVAVIAEDVDGEAAAELAGPGQIHQVTSDDIAAKTIIADNIVDNTIDVTQLAQILQLDATIIQTSDAGQRVVIDTSGITLFDSDGAVLVQLPTDPDAAATFTGQATLNAVEIDGGLMLRGTTNIMDNSSELLLRDQQGDPGIVPNLSIGYPATQLGPAGSSTTVCGGAWYDGTYVWTPRASGGEKAFINRYNWSTGASENYALEDRPAHVVGTLSLGVWGDGTDIWCIIYYIRAAADGTPYSGGDLVKLFQVTPATGAATVYTYVSGTINSGLSLTTAVWDQFAGQLYTIGTNGSGGLRIWAVNHSDLDVGSHVDVDLSASPYSGDTDPGFSVFSTNNDYQAQAYIPATGTLILLGGQPQAGGYDVDNYVALLTLTTSGIPGGSGSASYTSGDFNVKLGGPASIDGTAGGMTALFYDGANYWVMPTNADNTAYELSGFALDYSKYWGIAYTWQDATGNSPVTLDSITVASPAVFTCSAGHGLSVGDEISLTTTGALPTGLNNTSRYFVISAGHSTTAFEVSTSRGGSAVNTSGTQSGTQKFIKYDETGISPTKTFLTSSLSGAATPNLAKWQISCSPNGALEVRLYMAETSGTPVSSDYQMQQWGLVSQFGITSFNSSSGEPITNNFPGTGTSLITAAASAAVAPWKLSGNGEMAIPIFTESQLIASGADLGQIAILDDTLGPVIFDGESWVPVGHGRLSSPRFWEKFYEFIGGVPTNGSALPTDYLATATTGGGVVTLPGNSPAISSAKHIGLICLAPGGTSNSTGAAELRPQSNTGASVAGALADGWLYMSTLIQVPSASTVNWRARLGLVSSSMIAGEAPGFWFILDPDNVASSITAVAKDSSGTKNTVTVRSSVATAGEWLFLEILVAADGKSAIFQVNRGGWSSSAALNDANPAGVGNVFPDVVSGKNNTATGTRNMLVDNLCVAGHIAADRWT